MPRTPSPDNLLVGAGEIYFDRFDDDGNRTGLRHVGNCTSLEINHTSTDLVKKTSMDGSRADYKRINVERAAEVSIVMDEFHSQNYALASLGIEEALLQASGTATDESLNGGQPLNFGVWYPLTKASTHTDRTRQVTVTNVKQGATTLTLGTDYEKNTELGLIRLLSSGTADSEEACTWTGTIPAITVDDGIRQVRALVAESIIGRLLYIPASNQPSGPRIEIDVYRAQVQPDSAIQLITEEFGNFTIKVTALVDMARAEGDRLYKATYLDEEDVEDQETA